MQLLLTLILIKIEGGEGKGRGGEGRIFMRYKNYKQEAKSYKNNIRILNVCMCALVERLVCGSLVLVDCKVERKSCLCVCVCVLKRNRNVKLVFQSHLSFKWLVQVTAFSRTVTIIITFS